jgi:hypothetical protein
MGHPWMFSRMSCRDGSEACGNHAGSSFIVRTETVRTEELRLEGAF